MHVHTFVYKHVSAALAGEFSDTRDSKQRGRETPVMGRVKDPMGFPPIVSSIGEGLWYTTLRRTKKYHSNCTSQCTKYLVEIKKEIFFFFNFEVG